MTAPLGASAFASLGAVPVAAPLGASAFASLGAIPYSPPSQGPEILNNPIGQAAVGAGDAIKNLISSGINFVRSAPSSSQMQNASNMIGGMALPNIPQSPQIAMQNNSSGTNPTAYNVGNIGGNILGYLAGGEGAETMRAASEAIPGITGEIAKALGGTGSQAVARRAIGNAAYSGVTAPNDNVGQAEKGAAYSLGLDTIPAGIGKTLSYFNPNIYAKSIVSDIGGGQTTPEASKSVLSAIKNSYESKQQEAKNAYNSFIDTVPDSGIYPRVNSVYGVPSVAPTNIKTVSKSYSPVNYENPYNSGKSPQVFGTVIPDDPEPVGKSISSSIMSSGKQDPASLLDGNYPALTTAKNISNLYPSNIQDMHDNFIENPTFRNAHFLQSALGNYGRKLDSPTNPITPESFNQVQNIKNARSSLQGDMQNYLQGLGGNYSDQYRKLGENYLNEVVPYTKNSAIYNIAKGETTNMSPASLSGVFKAPEPDVAKVLSDLPDEIKDKILYTKLGQTVPTKSAQGLLNKYNDLSQQGLSDYVSPKLSQQMGELSSRIKAKNSLQSLIAAGAGASIGHEYGLGAMALGGAAGYGANAVASPFLNYMANRLPIEDIASHIGNVLRGTYPVGRSALLANVLNNSGVQNGS